MEKSKYTLNVIAYANKPYFKFVLPFLFFGLQSNPESHFEIILSDAERFSLENDAAIQKLRLLFGNRFIFSMDSNAQRDISPNTRRFLHETVVSSEWVYFGDIDILLMDNILSTHMQLINDNNLPFSNIIRDPSAEKPRLTGLHFVRYDDYFPVTFATESDLSIENDEHILYLIMSQKGLMVRPDFRIRPELGIHASLSRDPLGRFGLGPSLYFESAGAHGWSGIDAYKEVFIETIRSEGFSQMYSSLDISARLIFLIIESIIENKFSDIEEFVNRNVLNKIIFFDSFNLRSQDVIESVNRDIKDQNFDLAISKCRTALSLWPQFGPAKIELFYLFLAKQNFTAAKSIHHSITSDVICYNLFKRDQRYEKIKRFF